MKTLRIDPIYKPLAVSCAIVPQGSTSVIQVYDTASGAWMPDFRGQLTPLVLKPVVSVINKDTGRNGQMPTGTVTPTNIVWTMVKGGVRTVLTPDSVPTFTFDGATLPRWSVASDGTLTFRYNAEGTHPITLEFDADVYDSRQYNVWHHVHATYLVRCRTACTLPTLSLDLPGQNFYNPVRDTPDSVTVHASLTLGGTAVPTANRLFRWEVLENGAWRDIVGNPDPLDIEVTVATGGTAITVNRKLMGYGITLRCSAAYNSEGAATTAMFATTQLRSIIAFRRRIPKYDYEISQMPANIPSGTSQIGPTCVVRDRFGTIPDPGRFFDIRWFTATNTASFTNASFPSTPIANGARPIIPTSKMSATLGMMLAVDVVDRGPLMPWADADGKVLTDSNGAILLIN